jgi:TolB-like protein
LNDPGLSNAAVRTQLDKILASVAFKHVGRLREFLRYVVEESLYARTAGIKEYSIGLAVFERDEGFDCRLDPIVRVQAGRLRSKLAAYYSNEGLSDSVRIDLPVGSYVPVFRPNEAPPGAMATSTHLKTVSVLPFADYSPTGDLEYFCRGLTSEVIHALIRLGNIKVVSSIPVSPKRPRLSRIQEMAKRFGVSLIVDGNLRTSGDNFRITLHLIEAATGDVTWSKEWDREVTNVIAVQEEIAGSVAARLMQRVPADR